MKLSTTAVMFATVASAAAKTMSGPSAKRVLRNARMIEGSNTRKLEGQNDDQAAEEQEYSFLANYELKMVGCNAAETVVNAEDGEYEYGAVMLRLCPVGTCDSETANGCTEGYGDFVVGIATFVEAYFEDQRDNMNWDDQFEVDKYATCEEYEIENDGDDANNEQWENYNFFIGPTCTEDGLDIKLELYEGYEGQEQAACVPGAESSISFETISNGWTMPFSTGGLVSTYCTDCTQYNDDGEYELRELCFETYQSSANHCEEGMEFYSYYGQNTQGCEYLTEAFASTFASEGGNGGKIFGWIVLALVVVGLVGYVMWWRSKKAASQIES